MVHLLASGSLTDAHVFALFGVALVAALIALGVAGFAVWQMMDAKAQMRAIFSKLDAQARTFQEHATEVMRALGKLER